MWIIPFIILLLLVLAKCWRYYVESSDDLGRVKLLEPWYWFVFLNLILTLITSNYDYQFVTLGLIIQLALSVWFAISIGWIIQACPHKTGTLRESWFVKGKSFKYCFRCGARLPKEAHAHLIKDNSWQDFLFHIPPHLFEYIVFWVAQSTMALIVLFLTLKFLKNPEIQHQAAIIAVLLVVLAPPLIYSFGRFRRYLRETKGLIWWEDIGGSVLVWTLVLGGVWLLVRFL
ncbi:MAG TPA: hypothetical protein VMV05_10140 [bacterium]|nr:hypothetical protein [bacterium]